MKKILVAFALLLSVAGHANACDVPPPAQDPKIQSALDGAEEGCFEGTARIRRGANFITCVFQHGTVWTPSFKYDSNCQLLRCEKGVCKEASSF